MLARLAVFALLALAAPAFAQAPPAPPVVVTAIRCKKVVTMNARDEVLNDAVIIVRAGKIEAVGRAADVAIPDGAKVIDARDRWVVPGLIDCHDHVAGSLSDLNDGVWLTNPGLRTVDTISPGNDDLADALAGGVTTVLLLPGSGNNMSGFGTVTRTAGDTQAEMVRRAPGSIKVAQAGNPERYWFGVGRSYMNWNLRQTLEKARAYSERWAAWEVAAATARQDGRDPPLPPARDLRWDDYRGLFAGRFPASVHTQMYQVVNTTLTMLRDRFGLRVVLDHSEFDGYKNAPLVKDRVERTWTICGPRVFHFDRQHRRMLGLAGTWVEQGVEVGINTDAPVIPQEELSYQAALGCRLGLDPYLALRGLTIVPARALMVDDVVGSIEVGKEADLGLWTGDPIDPRESCRMTFVKGRCVYDAVADRRRF